MRVMYAVVHVYIVLQSLTYCTKKIIPPALVVWPIKKIYLNNQSILIAMVGKNKILLFSDGQF